MELHNRRRIDQINDMWEEDAPYSKDPDKLPDAATKNYSLIAKYHRIKTEEQRKLRQMQHTAESLRFRLLRLYRDGPLTPEEQDTVKQQGWEMPPEGRSNKNDLKYWVDTNPTLTMLILELGEQNDVIELLDDIIKTLHERNYSIASTAKQIRFIAGVND